MEGTPQLSSFLFFFSLLIIKHLSAYISHPPFPILPNSPHNLYLHTMTFSFGMKRLKALFRSSSDLSHLVMLPPLTERNIEFLANQSGWDSDDELTTEHSRETKISEWLQLLP